MIAAEAGLADYILEGDVGGARHRGHERAPGDAFRIARRLEEYPEIGAFHHFVLVAVSSTAKRAGTLASNGNCCSSRVHSAWMVWTSARPASPAHRRTICAPTCAASQWDAQSRLRGSRRPAQRHPASPNGRASKHPLRHVGGGRLGEGDAEDFFRCHVTEQQPDHALHRTWSCRIPHSPKRRRRPLDRTRALAWRHGSGMMRGAFTIPRSPVRRPPTIP